MKIGDKEATSIVVIYSLSLGIFVLTGFNVGKYGSGAWINSVIGFVLSYVFLIPVIRFFRIFGNENIVCASKKLFGKTASIVVGAVACLLVFWYASSVLYVSCDKISGLGNSILKTDTVRAVVCVAALVCALCGIEALTRQSYLFSFGIVFLIFLLIFTTVSGMSVDNMLPVFGRSAQDTIVPSGFVGLFGGMITLFLICDYFKGKRALIASSKKIVFAVNAVSIVLVIWYTLTVPYAVGESFGDGIEAVFTSASSGKFFRRFEVFLLSLYITVAIVTVSFGLFVSARGLCLLCDITDFRPFVLGLGVLLYYISDFATNGKSVQISAEIAAWFVFVFTLLCCVRGKWVKKR